MEGQGRLTLRRKDGLLSLIFRHISSQRRQHSQIDLTRMHTPWKEQTKECLCVCVKSVCVCRPGLDWSKHKSLQHESEKDVRINPSTPGDRDVKDPTH